MNLSEVDIFISTTKEIDISEKAGTSVNIPIEFSEIDIFCLMLAKFGHPNGPMTFSIPNGDPDAPWKWDFIFRIPGMCTIEIIRSWKSLEIRTRKIEVNPDNLIEFVSYNLNKHRNKIDEAKKSIQDYRLLINPYKRHKILAEEARKEIDKFSISDVFYPETMVATSHEIRKHNDSFCDYLKSMNRESSLSISLCTHSAFMIEAYLNLLIAILVKSEVKEDKAIFTETIERTWRKKIKRLHLDCQYISKIDFGNSIIRDVAAVFELRNKVAHSYPHKEDLTVSHMYFFKNFPILKNPLPFDKFQIAANNSLPTREEAIRCYDTAVKMIVFLESSISKDIKDNLKILINSNPLGFNEARGVYSVPFGSAVNKVFMPS